MSKIIEKYRKEAEVDFNSRVKKYPNLRGAILESIFAPEMKLPEGKGPMTHLHPDIDKLHLPHGMYIADWRKYRVEDHPSLMAHQKRCHAAGLHDPWARNFAFNYYPNIMWRRSRMAVATIGLGYGFCCALVLYVGEKVFDHFYPTTYKHTPEYVAKYGTKEVFH